MDGWNDRRDSLRRAHRTARAVRSIATRWRSLTSGPDASRRTLIACSGGADSSALAFALAAVLGDKAPALLALGHVVHDLRPAEEAFADRDLVRELGRVLSIPVLEAQVRVRDVRENAEAAARRLRYRALRSMACDLGAGVLATAHQGDDQLETLLMRLARGAGPRGMVGIPPSRDLGGGVRLVRPMLGVSRAQAEAICEHCSWEWAVDATNHEGLGARARLREVVIPEIKRIWPSAPGRADVSARVFQAAGAALGEAASAVLARGAANAGFSWTRADLRSVHEGILCEVIVRAQDTLQAGSRREQVVGEGVLRLAHAIRDHRDDRRDFDVGGMLVRVDASRVVMMA